MRRGFALPLTLVGMVVIGGMVAAILFVAVIGRRSGGAMVELARVQFAAETAAYRAAGGLTLSSATSIPVSDGPVDAGGASLTRFGSNAWWVEASESGGRFGTLRRSGLILISRPEALALSKGLATPGAVTLSATSRVDLYGIGAGAGCGWSDSLPAIQDFASPAYESLAGWLREANTYLPGGALVSPRPELVGGVCDEAIATNWGDPTDPLGTCSSFFPVVGVTGDLTVHGGRGQGVLVVRGNLTARAGFRFRGLVIVGGRMVLESGSQMFGAVQVDDSLRAGSVLDGGEIIYSACALRAALSNFGMISVPAERGWFQPY